MDALERKFVLKLFKALCDLKLFHIFIPKGEASTGVPVTLMCVVCGHRLRYGMSGGSSLALGVGNQAND